MSDGEKAAVHQAMRFPRLRLGVRQAGEMRRERCGRHRWRKVVQEEVQDVAAVIPPVDWKAKLATLELLFQSAERKY